MAILICAATADELWHLAPGVAPRDAPEMQPLRANFKQMDVVLLVTGVGPVNAALAAGFCLGLLHESEGAKIEGIALAGLAGAFDLDLCPLRSVWRVEREIWPEYGLNDGARITAKAFKHPLWELPDGKAVHDSLDLAASLPGLKQPKEEWRACASLTVAGVTASFARRDFLWNEWHAELENMEGFAVAYAAARAEIPMIEYRVVSNKTGPRGRDEKDFDGALKALGQILPGLGII